MKNFFYFSSSHRLAILILTFIIVSVSLITQVIKRQAIVNDYDFTKFQDEFMSLKQIKKQSIQKQSTNINFFYESSYRETYTKPKQQIIELNIADTIELEHLPHIGPSFAKHIFKYRRLLGGFYSKNQLLEVYGMDSTRYAQFEKFITIDTNYLVKNNINEMSQAELKKHPYISYKLAKTICNYRHQHGRFENIEDLLNIHLIDSNNFRKIVPYFTTDEKYQFQSDNRKEN